MADISKRLDKAEKYLQRGRPEAAVEEYLSILEEDPRNEQVRQSAADLCLALGRNGEAAALLSYLFEQEVEDGESAKGIVTYKKLSKISGPSPLQTYHYARLCEKKDHREALEAYETALAGFEKQRKAQQALAAARRIVELSPTMENLQRAGDKAAVLGDSKTAAACFVRLGQLKDDESPGSGFPWHDRAYNLDPMNLDAVLLFARGLFARNAVQECIDVLQPTVTVLESTPELRELYARALMAGRRPAEAEPYVWELFESDPQQLEDIASLVGVFLDVGDDQGALDLARKIEDHEERYNRIREFHTAMYEVSEKRQPSKMFVEYLASLLNTANRELEYSQTLLKLFQVYYAAGNYEQAGEALERAAELDPYERGHAKRLEMLRGKIDAGMFNEIARRFSTAGGAVKPAAASPVAAGPAASLHEPASSLRESEPTVLEDFILQAEIYLQYGMRSKALERLERVSKMFPGEERNNLKLRNLYISAGFTPKYPAGSAAARSAAGAAAAASIPGQPKGRMQSPSAPAPTQYAENAVDNFARVTEITRNIYRQASVKSVLFAAVNEIGKHFNASRCVAGLCTVGKPPSAALEYCAPGIKQSDVMSIVKLIGLTQQLASNGAVSFVNVKAAREFDPVRENVNTLGIESLLAVPLMDSGEQTGILILEQCAPRQWQQTDIVVVRTIAEQMVLAVSNARLRSLMKTLAVTDERSGLLKRSSYLDVLLSEVRRSLQQQTPLTVMLLHFGRASALIKEIGETQVENMMQQVSQILASHIRQNDVAVRYNMTTIALLLSDTTEKNAFLVVDKMRKVLASTKIPGTDRNPPISVGIAEAVLQEKFDPADIVTEAINRVENALEVARAEGGNKAHSLAANLQPSVA
jgi:diguanylate cyclase (GGDEF)-like protein